MATKTSISNRALSKNGARAVTNIDTDDTPESRVVLRFYDIALESILSETLWTFATKRVLLNATTDTIPFSTELETLSYCYQRPNDVIRIFGTNDTAAYWKEEADKILSDTSGLGIIYTYLNEDPALYTPSFVEAFSDKLAAEICFPLLNSVSKVKELLEVYEKISLPKAKSDNAQTGTPREVNDNYWLNARFGGPNVKEFS